MSTKEYIKNVIKNPKIASITPTSQSGVKEVCSKINVRNKLVIVEYGPGTGVFTEHLLKLMSDDSLLIAVELNDNFVNHLNANFSDSRLKIHHDNAENIDLIMEQHGVKADYVISGIPFTLLPDNTRNLIVKKTYEILNEAGKFIAYQAAFQKDKHLLHHLDQHFSFVENKYFLKNIPPLRVYEATK